MATRQSIGLSRGVDSDGPAREVEIKLIDKTVIWIPATNPQKEIERIASLVKNACN